MDRQENARAFNELFVERTSIPEGVKEAQEGLSRIIQQRVWEDGFARKFLPKTPITRDTPGVQEDLTTDTIYYLAYTEVLTHAMSCNIRGDGDSQIFYGRKFPIGLWKIQTFRHHTDEATIRSLPYKFTEMIEKQFPYLIQMIEDRTLLLHVEAAVWRVQQWDDPTGFAAGLSSANIANGTAKEISVVKGEMARNMTDMNYNVTLLNKNDVPYVARLFPGTSGEAMEGKSVLFNQFDLYGVNTWNATEIGNEAATELTFGQFKRPTLAGFKWVVTNKTSILRPGCAYMFADPQFLGFFISFMDTKMYVERYGAEYESWAQEIIGMGFGNLRGVKKLELFSGSATPGAETSADVVNVRPLSERQIVKENAVVDHRTSEGVPDGYIPPLY